MKVVLLVTFTFLDENDRKWDNSPTYQKEIEMPVSPVGVDVISIEVGRTPVQAKLKNILWSNSLSSFVVEGVVTAGDRLSRVLADDKSWKPTR